MGGHRHEAQTDAERWGLDPAFAAPPEDAAVWRENAAAVEAFLAVASQWRLVGLASGRVMAVGLDYQGARAGLELRGTDVSPDLWLDLQVIEAGALGAMNGSMMQ